MAIHFLLSGNVGLAPWEIPFSMEIFFILLVGEVEDMYLCESLD